MFTVHVHAHHGIPQSENAYAAWKGFTELGCHIEFFEDEDELRYNLRLGDCVVGWISDAIQALEHMDVPLPQSIDFPEQLRPYYGRRIWETRLSAVADHPETWPIFCKSVKQKGFTGRVVRSPADLRGCAYQDYDREVFCSEVLDLQSEWRGFVRHGKLIDVRGYKGKWDVLPDPEVMKAACQAWDDKPAGCSIDFGVTSEGRTVVIECNDGFALGNYGLNPLAYAKLISARWHQLIGQPDPFLFTK